MSDPETDLRALHQLYCKLTGRNLKYLLYQREWCDFTRHQFTAADLELVFQYVEAENRQRDKRFQIRTELLRIIGDLAVFDSLRAEAELWQKAKAAKKRQWQPSPAEKVLADFRGEEPTAPEQPAKRLSLDFVADALRKAKQ